MAQTNSAVPEHHHLPATSLFEGVFTALLALPLVVAYLLAVGVLRSRSV